MTDTDVPRASAANHVEETIRSISQLRAEHDENATPFQLALDNITATLSQPWTIAAIIVIVVVWVNLNLLLSALGLHPFDPPPFAWLGEAVSLASLCVVVLILATQRREDQLVRRRELLILELAILSEQKTAKVIQLLEEYRRDNPMLENRPDPVADTMSHPADPKFVLDVMKRPKVPDGQKDV